jgi:hypothetical protein
MWWPWVDRPDDGRIAIEAHKRNFWGGSWQFTAGETDQVSRNFWTHRGFKMLTEMRYGHGRSLWGRHISGYFIIYKPSNELQKTHTLWMESVSIRGIWRRERTRIPIFLLLEGHP